MEIKRLLEKIGVKELNAMQQEALDMICSSDDDIVVLSPTGTGKTLAYLLPLTKLVDATSDELQVIVVVPGRELALQSANVLKGLSAGIRSLACYGGRPAMDEHRLLRQVSPQVVFGTPGRLNDHLDKGNISPAHVGILVIDEFDKCLEMGFSDEMSRLIAKLPNVRRRILLSATDAEEITSFVGHGNIRRVDYLANSEEVSGRIALHRVDSPVKDKLETLRSLLLSVGNGSTIAFLNYRESVERTAAYLSEQGFSVSAFHGGLDQRGRETALYRFANGSACVLVSTDLGSRGLDIPDVENIIHYHMPETQEAYLHRVGRTARWDKDGNAFFILAPGETVPEYVEGDIVSYVPYPKGTPARPRMTTLYIGKGKKDKISKGDLVGFLCKKGGLEKDDIGRIDVRDYYCYVAVTRSKAAEMLKKVRGEKIKGLRTLIEIAAPEA